MSAPDNGSQLFELKFTATGEVRDADGNLLNQDATAETTVIVTEQEARELLAQHNPDR